MITNETNKLSYKKLSEVCDFKGGGTPSKHEPAYWNGDIPWASVKDIKGSSLVATQDKISKLGLNNSTVSLAQPGDLILVSRISPGKSTISKIEVAINQDLKIVSPKLKISPKFLHYFFQSIERQILNLSSGTTVLGITLNSLNEILFPDIPFEKQLSIVSKIEELFSELDKGIESLKLAQQQLKVYRQSLLKWAFEGKLTNEDVKEGELPEGWKIVKLKSISESIQYGYTESASKDAIGPKFLRITDIQENRVEWKDVPYCKITKDNKKKYLLKDGDLVFARTGATVGKSFLIKGEIPEAVFARTGATVGKSFLIKGEIPEAVFASYLIRVRVKTEINERFLSYFFLSPIYWNQITEGQVGIGQPNVNGSKLGQLDIVLAPLKDQSRIVEELENHLCIADKMEESITQGLQQAETMRQSILKRAFEGKLAT